MAQNKPEAHTISFEYRPLDRATGEIRLLDILPGQLDGQIQCVLRYARRDEEPAYEALSYAWGDENDRLPILIRGDSIAVSEVPKPDEIAEPVFNKAMVTRNLEAALRYIRRSTDTATIWVDALCINQEDIQERAAEVRRMGSIYGSASSVRVWLGELGTGASPDIPATDSSDIVTALAFVMWNSSRVDKRADVSFDSVWESYCESISVSVHQAGELRSSLRRGVLDILRFPWWTRRWVLQEALLPRGKISLHCGTYEADFGEFVLAFYGSFSKSFHTLGYVGGVAMLTRRLYPFGMHHDYVLTLPLYSRMFYVLGASWALRSKDARDTLYGLWGLLGAEMEASEIRPDYSMPLDLFYKSLARFIVEQGGAAAILDCGRSRDIDVILPSWVPTWDRTQSLPILDQTPFRPLSSARVSACGNILRIRAVPLGTVVQVVDAVPDSEDDDLLSKLRSYLRHWEQAVVNNPSVLERHNHAEAAVMAFHTLVYLWGFSFHRLSYDDWTQAREQTGSSEDANRGGVPGQIAGISWVLESHQLVITSSGRIGLFTGNDETPKEGALVYMVPGCMRALLMQRTVVGLRILGDAGEVDMFAGTHRTDMLEAFRRSELEDIEIV